MTASVTAPLRRFHTLDGMRGVAALVVSVYHYGQRANFPDFPGYLAVDLFFVLSGFVIALNYTDRLAAGLSLRAFAVARLQRLYPLYFVGWFLGIGKQVIGKVAGFGQPLPLPMLATAALLNLFMLPLPSAEMFPLNGPSWSLFFELAVNLIFAVGLWRAPSQVILASMAVAGIWLVCSVGAPLYLNIGWGLETATSGFARTVYSFGAGVLLFRHVNLGKRYRTPFALAPMVATVMLLLTIPPQAYRIVFELACIAIVFPILILAGLRWECPVWLERTCGVLGDISYPIYVSHWPLLAIAVPLLQRVFAGHPALAGIAFAVAMIAIAVPLSLADTKFRAWLHRRSKSRARTMATPGLGPNVSALAE